jgi:hypothetical protein
LDEKPAGRAGWAGSSTWQNGKKNATRRDWHTDKEREEMEAPETGKNKRLVEAGVSSKNARILLRRPALDRVGRNFEQTNELQQRGENDSR